MNKNSQMPLTLNKPDFKYEFDTWLPFQINVEVGEDGHKTEAQTLLHLRTENGGYPMKIAVQVGTYDDRRWHVVEDIYDVGVLIEGSWERSAFIEAFQKAGLMLLPYYGKMDSSPEEEKDAIREQT